MGVPLPGDSLIHKMSYADLLCVTETQGEAPQGEVQPGDKPVFDSKVTGLMLTRGKAGSKRRLRFTSLVTGNRRDAGFGIYPEVSIADARDKALAMRRQLDAGKDPIDERNREATAHGHRSSFRDWASESGYARDLAERALAHTVSNKVEAAYHRTDLLNSAARRWKHGREAHIYEQATN